MAILREAVIVIMSTTQKSDFVKFDSDSIQFCFALWGWKTIYNMTWKSGLPLRENNNLFRPWFSIYVLLLFWIFGVSGKLWYEKIIEHFTFRQTLPDRTFRYYIFIGSFHLPYFSIIPGRKYQHLLAKQPCWIEHTVKTDINLLF